MMHLLPPMDERADRIAPEGGSMSCGVWGLGTPVLSERFALPEAASRGERVVAWTGSASGGCGSDLFGPEPGTWSGRGWRALAARLPEVLAECRNRGLGLWLRPHHRHVVSDAPSIRKVLAEFGGDGTLAVLVEPAGLISPGMMALATDHLNRLGELLAGIGSATGVVESSVRLAEGKEDVFELCDLDDPAGGGVLPEEPLKRALASMLAADGGGGGVNGGVSQSAGRRFRMGAGNGAARA
ncbi:MAG: hypothetical protein ACT4PL_14195 [Phycisphaerales bacterium]